MQRWQQDFHVSRREWRKHRRMHVAMNVAARQGSGPQQKPPGFDPFVVDCRCDDQVGRFRKIDAWDCGKTQCVICHGAKFPKRELTRQEQAAAITLREELRGLFSQ
jgi:hypothetical protein